MFKDLLLNKKEVEEQKRETWIQKMRIEFELRAEQCTALELDLIEPDAVEEDIQERVALIQKKVQSLEQQLGEDYVDEEKGSTVQGKNECVALP